MVVFLFAVLRYIYSNKCAGASARGGVGARARGCAGARKSLRVASGVCVHERERASKQVCESRAMAYARTREREGMSVRDRARFCARARARARARTGVIACAIARECAHRAQEGVCAHECARNCAHTSASARMLTSSS